ncbi:BMP family ABC transporter substrate-binding protein [Candidatus Leptofilum sp.]|uniref:BMP family ABC transporter substrate-binding protein n=1 Tax=Candidatus Leptofilum sp. TaxID=3241576 RepID=UPI003B5CABB9
MNKRNIFSIFFVFLLALVVGCGGETAEDGGDYKLAAVFPGTITDADYNTLGNLGIEAVNAEHGVEIAFSESVAVPDVERVMREYIDDGFNIIFTHGGQFLSQTLDLANEFPDVNFIAEADAAIEDAPGNVWVIVRNMEIGAYGAGAVAAQMTQTGKIGYITGLTLPLTYAEYHAIEQAISDFDLSVEVVPVWVGDFNDPSKARELADTLIADDVDVIISSLNLGTLGVFEAAEAIGPEIKVIAKYTDKSEFAPDNYVSSMLYDFEGPLTDIVGEIIGGNGGGNYHLGFDTGIDLQLPLTNASDEVNSAAEALLEDMKAGNVEVIKDTTPIE